MAGLAVFLIVAGLALWQQVKRKSEGNHYGVFAVLWIALTPVVAMMMDKLPIEMVNGFVGRATFFEWLFVPVGLAIFGRKSGTPFSKDCATYLLLAMLAGVICVLMGPRFAGR